MLKLLAPNPPSTPGAAKKQQFFEAAGQANLFRALCPEPRGGSAAAPGRRRFWPPGGCHRLGLRCRASLPEKKNEKIMKNDIKKQKS